MRIIIILLLLFIPSLAYAAIDFNGDADYINVGNHTPVWGFAGKSFSIAARCHTDNAANDYQAIIAKRDDSPAYGWMLQYRGASTVDWAFQFDNSGGVTGYASLNCTQTVTNGDEWWVIASFNQSNDTTMMWGKKIGGYIESNDASNNDQYTPGVTDANVTIGCRLVSGDQMFFDGVINEVYLFERQITEEEAYTIMNSEIKGVGRGFSNCVGYWSLDDVHSGGGINGAYFVDSSSTGYTAQGIDADGDSFSVPETYSSYPE